jgi:type I restriction-modification system DNA methylase subunit
MPERGVEPNKVVPTAFFAKIADSLELGELIDLVSGIGMGAPSDKAKDILGRVYEYFLGGFAGSEGKRGGEFYTPRSVVRVLVEMLEPYKGRVYDPCCGSGGIVRSNPNDSSKAMAGGSATSPSTGRSQTTRRGGSPK